MAARVLGAREAGLARRWAGAGRAAGARPLVGDFGAGFAAWWLGVREAALVARGAAALFVAVGRPTERVAGVLARDRDARRTLGPA